MREGRKQSKRARRREEKWSSPGKESTTKNSNIRGTRMSLQRINISRVAAVAVLVAVCVLTASVAGQDDQVFMRRRNLSLQIESNTFLLGPK